MLDRCLAAPPERRFACEAHQKRAPPTMKYCFLNLSDEELALVMKASEPIRVEDRGEFLREVAERMNGDDTVLAKVLAEVRRKFLGER